MDLTLTPRVNGGRPKRNPRNVTRRNKKQEGECNPLDGTCGPQSQKAHAQYTNVDLADGGRAGRHTKADEDLGKRWTWTGVRRPRSRVDSNDFETFLGNRTSCLPSQVRHGEPKTTTSGD